MAYTIGVLSGCHINPAITLGAWLCGRIKTKDALLYIIFQVIGAVIGSTLLYVLVDNSGITFEGTMTGANACSGNVTGGLFVEMVLTFIFVLVVLGTTDDKKGTGNFAGLAIGLCLILIHFIGINILKLQ